MEKQQLEEMIDQVVDRTFALDYTWDWPACIAFYGVARAWEATGRTEYAERVMEWIDKIEAIGFPPFTVNAVSLGHVLLSLYQLNGEQKYLDLAERMAEYLTHEAARFGDGVLQHTVSQNYNFPEQAWADTLFMAAYFLVRIGKQTDNNQYFRDGLNQFYWHIEYLQDKKTQLFYHGWDNINQNNLSAIHWGRANAWAALTMAETLELLDAFEPIFMELSDALRDQLAALVRVQDGSGFWHTVVDDPASYLETSASCGIANALAVYDRVNGFPLYKNNYERAFKQLSCIITEQGAVAGVSAGTAVMHCLEDYRNVPCKRVQGWGQGLALSFLAELYKTACKSGEADMI